MMTSIGFDPDIAAIRRVEPRSTGCEECLRLGTPWVHLRLEPSRWPILPGALRSLIQGD